ncbi:coenzyme Q-binding protein COQ10 [Hasllibacter halocynthiae]|uniref:Coenzyme Q-binding protein COQ10 n=1 Tax=Hasllibacter halocynthiae TaxID=595589 RepID=A0A2T0X8B6_9RHOB|nr:type II toxin-antitoxin system RatA family toxin [Hasllibacter halocynthiae]PRY95176.1 coenzyme Q-binding protein COQ10 [Hasllibacter halocynthiae]
MPHHHERRTLPYTPQQMYDLVADVSSYPAFLPWIAAARVRSVEEEGDHLVMLADLVISFKVFRERFGSRVVLRPGERVIETSYVEGPFRQMDSTWRFHDVESDPDCCEIEFEVDFEFKSRLLQGAANMFFQDAMQRIVRAFERRAAELHAPKGNPA